MLKNKYIIIIYLILDNFLYCHSDKFNFKIYNSFNYEDQNFNLQSFLKFNNTKSIFFNNFPVPLSDIIKPLFNKEPYLINQSSKKDLTETPKQNLKNISFAFLPIVIPKLSEKFFGYKLKNNEINNFVNIAKKIEENNLKIEKEKSFKNNIEEIRIINMKKNNQLKNLIEIQNQLKIKSITPLSLDIKKFSKNYFNKKLFNYIKS